MEQAGKETISLADSPPPQRARNDRGERPPSDLEGGTPQASSSGGGGDRRASKSRDRGKGKEENRRNSADILDRSASQMLDARSMLDSKNVGGNDGSMSARSDFSVRTALVEQHSQNQPQDAASLKAALKEFVADMVRGRELQLQPRGGNLRPIKVRVTTDVSALLVGEDKSLERVPLGDLVQIHRGLEAVPLDLGIQLDANMVVLELASGNCLTFQLGIPKAADEFILFMRLLTAMQRKQRQQSAKGGGGKDDDTRSVCSVQTATCQKTLNSTPLSAVANDPKEVKKMFKMFTETMRRGRDFYVVKADGTLQDVECALSKGNDEFRMRWDFQNRILPLREMTHIRTCEEVAKLSLGFHVDEKCATVELHTGECITFKFGHVEACERFILCMRILVDQKRPHFASKNFGGGGGGAGAPPGEKSGPSKQMARASSSASISSKASRQNGGGSVVSAGGGMDTKATVEAFVKTMVAGCDLNVVGPNGLMQVRCSMGADLRAIEIAAHDGSKRQVELAAIKAVHVGQDVIALGLDGVAADEMCATVEMVTGDCLTFRFPKVDQRDRFAACVRIFASAHKQ